MAHIIHISEQISVRECAAGGWLALSEKPPLGASGRTPEEAQTKLIELIGLFRRLADRAGLPRRQEG